MKKAKFSYYRLKVYYLWSNRNHPVFICVANMMCWSRPFSFLKMWILNTCFDGKTKWNQEFLQLLGASLSLIYALLCTQRQPTSLRNNNLLQQMLLPFVIKIIIINVVFYILALSFKKAKFDGMIFFYSSSISKSWRFTGLCNVKLQLKNLLLPKYVEALWMSELEHQGLQSGKLNPKCCYKSQEQHPILNPKHLILQ